MLKYKCKECGEEFETDMIYTSYPERVQCDKCYAYNYLDSKVVQNNPLEDKVKALEQRVQELEKRIDSHPLFIDGKKYIHFYRHGDGYVHLTDINGRLLKFGDILVNSPESMVADYFLIQSEIDQFDDGIELQKYINLIGGEFHENYKDRGLELWEIEDNDD